MAFKYITIAVLLAMILFAVLGNAEFLLYGTGLLVLSLFLWKTDAIAHYTRLAKACFFAWLLLHIAGGSVPIGNGLVLYNLILLPVIGPPFDILRYDQVIHAFCYFTIAQLVYSLLMATLHSPHLPRLGFFLIVWLVAMGVGAVNEIIEFTAVAFIPDTNVGDYINNALDLVFNGLGAALACLLLAFHERRT